MDSDEVTLFIDLGTNGELVLGNRDQRFIASAPAGPALEGGKLTWGTASISGAICGVRIEGSKAIVRTIDGAFPSASAGPASSKPWPAWSQRDWSMRREN